MKKMTSPTSWFGLRTKSSSKRSVSPVPVSAPISSTTLPLRSSMRSSRSQGAEDLARRGAYLHPVDSSKSQEHLTLTPRASETQIQGETARFRSGEDVLRSNREDLVKTYLSWVNAHLKKRKDSDKVTDLATALQDGVTLLNLAEILSSREVTDSLRVPQTREEREVNVSKVLSFLLEEGLEVRSVSCSEIMKGNMKHILRVIYSMACHYKANPIQQPGLLAENKNDSLQSSPALNEYANLKQQVNEFEKKLRGNALIAKYRRMSINSNILSDVEGTAGGYETDETVCDGDENYDCIPKAKPNNHLEEPIYVNMPLCQMSNPPVNTISDNDFSNILRNSKSSSDLISTQDTVLLSSTDNGVHNRVVHVYSESSSDQIMTGYDSPPVKQENMEICFDELSVSLSELSPIKHQIMQVQTVLGGYTDLPGLQPDVNLLQSQLADVQMKLDDKICQLSESEEKRGNISSQLSVVVQECTDLSNRLTESLSIRADVLRKDYLLQNSESENLSLRIAVREKDEIIKQLNGRLLLREELLSTLESQVSELNREKERQVKGRTPGIDSHPTLSNLSDVSETPAHLSAKVKDVCGMLFTLRARVNKDPACSQLIDSVEDGLYAIVERLYYYASRSTRRNSREGRRGQSPRPGGRNHTSESPNSTLNKSNSSANSFKAEGTDLDPNELVVIDICHSSMTPDTQTLSKPLTRVIYYVNQQETPSRVTVQKPPSLVKLSDVKSQINRVGNFSYYFKVNDPDFGAVKEEIRQDTDCVPVYKKNTVVVYLESHDL